MCYVSSRSGVVTLRTAIHLLLTYLVTYLHVYATDRRRRSLYRQSRGRLPLAECKLLRRRAADSLMYDIIMLSARRERRGRGRASTERGEQLFSRHAAK